MNGDNFGIVKVAGACPKLKVANPDFNVIEIEKLIKEANDTDSYLIVFPELSITGYTCGDLFLQRQLIDRSITALEDLLLKTKDTQIVALIGMPILVNGRLYNCGIAIQSGKILGAVPKMYIPNYKEFYEKRWFNSGYRISKEITEININGQIIPFGNLIFENEKLNFSFGIEICEDLWVPIPPSSYLTINGAMIIANLSASNELVSKGTYRKNLVSSQSARCVCGYIYASSGVHESTTDVVFGGDCIIAENGGIVGENEKFRRESTITYSYIDTEKLIHERSINNSFGDIKDFDNTILGFRKVKFEFERESNIEKLNLKINQRPFIPSEDLLLNERCKEIFNIQVAGLAKRLEHTRINKAVIGISGGLDSTLALLVIVNTFDLLQIPRENIHGITMPGFGTTNETYTNSMNLMKSMGITIKEIDIKPSCLQHFNDIGHDASILDVTYENVQARERTQVLMDYSNKVDGLVVGTGDLSELVLGWCTYNGDHMSMYAVNTSIPKTLVKFLVNWVAEHISIDETKEILKRIIDMPISPELLPPDSEGNIQQKTEDIVGPYILHDFFIYYCLRFGMQPKKILYLAKCAFVGMYCEDEIRKCLKMFYRRFFTQQFKRSCLPDGPKVGSVCISPRGDLRMPSDADMKIWIDEL